MMKKFILIVCGSFVGAFLAFMFFMFAAMMMSIAIMGSMNMETGKSVVKVSKHSILMLDLGTPISERNGVGGIDMMSLLQGDGMPTSIGLNTVLDGIQKAADNKNIDGIFIKCNGVSAAPATLEAVRHALKDFKKSGKWIAAYGYEGINQADYYLASVADSIYLNPVGAVDIHGMASVIPYMKKLFDKIGVDMQVVRVGTFKSAVEPYILDDISEANRLQTETYLGAIWSAMRDSIAVDRKLTSAALNSLADSVVVTFEAKRLVNEKLVDKLVYQKEMYDILCARTSVDEADDLNFVTCGDIADDQEKVATGEHIAVVYAVGEIDGSSSLGSSEEGIDSEELSSTIHDLMKDDNVKGMVLRVNSPGGSAFGSEQIWKAVMDFKATGKPVAVSMGDYAASGGYYISCCADRIFAERTTIRHLWPHPLLQRTHREQAGCTHGIGKDQRERRYGCHRQETDTVTACCPAEHGEPRLRTVHTTLRRRSPRESGFHQADCRRTCVGCSYRQADRPSRRVWRHCRSCSLGSQKS